MEQKLFVTPSVLYVCDFLSLLWKGVQNECALLKYLYSFLAAELNNIQSEDNVFAQEFLCKQSDYEGSSDEDI